MLVGSLHLLPEALMVAAGLVALFGEYLPGKDRGAAYAGAAAAAIAALLVLLGSDSGQMLIGRLDADELSRFARASIAGITAAWLVWAAWRTVGAERSREAVALALFAASGAMALAGATDLIVIYVALELATLPALILLGYRRSEVRALESVLGYLLLSMLASAVMLYGFSFLFGLSGSTALARIDLAGAGSLGVIAAALSVTGLLVKLLAAPVHFWAREACANALPVAAAFVLTVPAIGVVAVTGFLFAALAPDVPALSTLLAAAALAAMFGGSVAAWRQQETLRFMSCLGVAHTGFILLVLAGGAQVAHAAALLYAVAYAILSMTVMLAAAEEGPALSDLRGFVARRPWGAWVMVVCLLSLTGLPPLVGVFGGIAAVDAASDWGFGALVAVCVAATLLLAACYVRVVRIALSRKPDAF